MKKLTLTLLSTIAGVAMMAPAANATSSGSVDASASKSSAQCAPFLNHSFRKLHAKDQVDLCELTAGKPVLVINTASNCGFTPQFKALEALHKEYKDQGLVVVGFPSDDFFQEEDDEKDTAEVCFVNYGVTFTMLQTSPVRGSDANPVFKHLADETTAPKWNFYKYLISKDGKQVKHFNSRVKPDEAEFIQAVQAVL
nr:glutathione peroxidase [Thalassotalea euphylliae]